MCQNTTMRVNEAWIKTYCVLCSKTYNTLLSCRNFPAGSRQAARGAGICEIALLAMISLQILLNITVWHAMIVYIVAVVPYAKIITMDQLEFLGESKVKFPSHLNCDGNLLVKWVPGQHSTKVVLLLCVNHAMLNYVFSLLGEISGGKSDCLGIETWQVQHARIYI